MTLREHLMRAQGIRHRIDAGEMHRLETLEALLAKWGSVLGLTGLRGSEARARRYFAEALAALPYLPEKGRALDIGSGGGSPALPLAVMRRGLSWVLVESNERKACFLEEAVRALALDNVRVASHRYEAVTVPQGLAAVTCRGVKLSSRALSKIHESMDAGGRFLWFSGEERLRQARDAQAFSRDWAIEGPRALLPDEVRAGWLLVMEKASALQS